MTELDRMLMRLRAGETDPALIDQVYAALAVDPRLPAELRDPPDLRDEPAEAAEALLAVLGHDDGWLSGLLGGALRAEAEAPAQAAEPPVELTGEPLRAALQADERAVALPIAQAVRALAGDVALSVASQDLPPILQAVRASAGTVDLGVEVLVRLGLLPVPVQRAVAVEAGEADVTAQVVGRSVPVAQAVRAEAGSLDHLLVANALLPVAAAVRAEAGGIDIAATVGEPLAIPVAAAVRAEAGAIDVVAAVLGSFGVPVAGALAAEAGTVELASAVVPDLVPVAQAVRAEAGGIDIAAVVDEPLEILVAQAVRAEAGGIDLVASVLGSSRIPVAVALAAEAGTVELASAVVPDVVPVAQAVRAEAGGIDIAGRVLDAVRRSALGPAPLVEPAAANRGRFWGWAGVALAAAAMLVIIVGRLVPLGGPAGALGLIDLPDFAMLDEVRVEDLSYGERANAAVIPFQDDAGNGVLVIWVEEESDV